MEKRILIDLDSLTRNEEEEEDGGWYLYLKSKWIPKPKNTFIGVEDEKQVALERLFAHNWMITLWTTRPQNEYVELVEDISNKPKIWSSLDSEKTFLIRNPLPGEDEVKTKLSLLERNFSQTLDNSDKLITVEPSRSWANLLEEYTNNRVIAHNARDFWQKLPSQKDEGFDRFIYKEE